jgi:chloramphenicol 3-O-phosphotransferase
MNISNRIFLSILTVLLLFCITPSVNAWILVFNGPSSTGKSTLARNLQNITQQQTKIIQLDTEGELLVEEMLGARGYRRSSELAFNDWIDSLPKEFVQKFDEEIDRAACGAKIVNRIIEKTQKLDQAGINVIIDTVLENEAEYKRLASPLCSAHTYFVLVYASIDQLLKNVIARNNSGNSSEKRELGLPFGQFFFDFFKPCEVTSPEKLDVLAKKDFENVFRQLENLIESDDQEDFKEVDSKVNSMFFEENDVVGIASKLPPHDFVINTGITSSIECASALDAWLACKIK